MVTSRSVCCGPTYDVRLKDKAYNGVHRLLFNITKDEIVWAGIDSVLAIFLKPDGETYISRPMILSDDATGAWYYDTVSGDLDTVGYWTMTLEVTDGTIVLEYPYSISFRVNNQPNR